MTDQTDEPSTGDLVGVGGVPDNPILLLGVLACLSCGVAVPPLIDARV
jgi:hypothetical protein